ncbi:uncharacterized protein NMK_2434 [Novimethylophilus kurashikiensis]|uniref:Uncharacterized protein n=1 Tax=Novimethylophilus kurashikiensis TaxID=1825523 RepID=A0A2R5FD52_9PROT|nr:hypothetical protein [Novimethylophilus kurashikiensis]GBG14833.1 uncharacterized protein NMK_2434 [Novimethylophilus kurashikiensis]
MDTRLIDYFDWMEPKGSFRPIATRRREAVEYLMPLILDSYLPHLPIRYEKLDDLVAKLKASVTEQVALLSTKSKKPEIIIQVLQRIFTAKSWPPKKTKRTDFELASEAYWLTAEIIAGDVDAVFRAAYKAVPGKQLDAICAELTESIYQIFFLSPEIMWRLSVFPVLACEEYRIRQPH